MAMMLTIIRKRVHPKMTVLSGTIARNTELTTMISTEDPAKLPQVLLGFDANNKKNYFLDNPELPKDLSISCNGKLVFSDIPLKTERGINAPAQAMLMKPT
jgi:hypothetical protein